jgi:Uma2 family endonuclease
MARKNVITPNSGIWKRRITNVDNRLEMVNDIHDINMFILLIRVEEHLLHTKGRVDMTTSFDRLPTVTPASWIPGPGQGHWTYNDYAALPDDGKRYEIVNGVLYMTPSPTGPHQDAVGRFYAYLLTHVETAGLGKIRIAPFDVELAPDVVVQPDVFVVLKANFDKITKTRIIGAPDLVIEVSSPSTVGYDRREKQDAYASAGVPEYWVAHPTEREVEVLVLENGKYRSLGIFEGHATLPSQVLAGLPVQVEQFFA